MATPDAAIPTWLEAARARLHADQSHALRMRRIAGEVGIHPVHLSRSFRRRFGMTMSRYLRDLRLEAARRSLLETGHSIARIAAEHGFADQAHFTRTFKGATGLTPRAYRRRSGAGPDGALVFTES